MLFRVLGVEITLQHSCDTGVTQMLMIRVYLFVVFLRHAWIVSVEVARTPTWPTVRRS